MNLLCKKEEQIWENFRGGRGGEGGLDGGGGGGRGGGVGEGGGAYNPIHWATDYFEFIATPLWINNMNLYEYIG